MIEINYLKQLLEIFDESTVQDLRIEKDGVEIRLSKNAKRESESGMSAPGFSYAPLTQPQTPATTEQTGGAHAPAAAELKATTAESQKKYHEIRSPIVGTFYRAPTPDTPTFVEVGQAVSPGMVLCIIEAMKLMNEIECDSYGKIAKVLVENAQPVEYNQILFLVEPE